MNMDDAKIKDLYRGHLESLCEIFNRQANDRQFPIRLGLPATELDEHLQRIMLNRFSSAIHHQGSNLLCESHISGLVRYGQEFSMVTQWEVKFGHISDPDKVNRTTTALLLQWLGPIHYLLEGLKYYPIYLVESRVDRKKHEVRADQFFKFYQDVEVIVQSPSNYSTQTLKSTCSLRDYRKNILTNAHPDVFVTGARFQSIEAANNEGLKVVYQLAELRSRLREKGFFPLFIVDMADSTIDFTTVFEVIGHALSERDLFHVFALSPNTAPNPLNCYQFHLRTSSCENA